MEWDCSGPEVEVNIVLLEDEALFSELCDDLRKPANINGPTVGSLTDFHELNSVRLSVLPKNERDLLITSFADSLSFRRVTNTRNGNRKHYARLERLRAAMV